MNKMAVKNYLITFGAAALLSLLCCCTPKDNASEHEAGVNTVPSSSVSPSVSPSSSIHEKSVLANYYKNKYSRLERDVITKNLPIILEGYSKEEINEAADEILEYRHLIYHRTKYHNLLNNHAAARAEEDVLKLMCERHEVPFEPILAIVSWENSGSSSKVSWADAAGLGQMTPGAVERAHQYAKDQAEALKKQAAILKESGEPQKLEKADELERKAVEIDCAERHKKLAHLHNVNDERFVAECNLEDVALFYKYLSEKFSGRADLTISAYHNGLLNNDDIICAYSAYNESPLVVTEDDRSSVLFAVERFNLKYIDLWKCPLTRGILNGARTVTGERTTSANAHMALGDESDLYVWKVLGSWVGYKAGPEFVAKEIELVCDPWDISEVKGLALYDSAELIDKAKKKGLLTELKTEVMDCGYKAGRSALPISQNVNAASANGALDNGPSPSAGAFSGDNERDAGEDGSLSADVVSDETIASDNNASGSTGSNSGAAGADDSAGNNVSGGPGFSNADNYGASFITPELAGYLADLTKRIAAGTGNDNVKLPLKALAGLRVSCTHSHASAHKRGVAADFDLGRLPKAHREVLTGILHEDYLLGKIYMFRKNGNAHIVLNPRYGEQFVEMAKEAGYAGY